MSVLYQITAYAFGFLFYIKAFHRYIEHSNIFFQTQSFSVQSQKQEKRLVFLKPLEKQLFLRTLRPINLSNVSPSRITAAAGTRVSQDLLKKNKSFF
jgi:hypothetical protein